jgi:hypothetical protein
MSGEISSQQSAGGVEIDQLVQEAKNEKRRVSVTTVAGDTYTGTGEEVRSTHGTITIETGDETYVVPVHAVASVRSRQ